MTTSSSDSSALVENLRAAGCVFAEEEAQLLLEAAGDPSELEAMLAARVSGEPLEYVVGWAEFCGLRIGVIPGVFVPRRRTELLASEAIAIARRRTEPVIVDLCCGAGAIAAAISTAVPSARILASDLSPEAVGCARGNLSNRAIEVFQGDLFAALPGELRGRVDVLVANAPYVPTDAIGLMPPEARLHEQRMALDGGEDGLELARRIVSDAGQWLADDGSLLIETSEQQADALAAAFADAGLRPNVRTSPELGATVIVGALPAATTPQRLA
ncbi:release factor glutamine methyltransferase [Frankineae bacterium MT45]|nr:release factor glutamine methyltransferase [Frankineae bacterium MT45]